MAHGRLWLPFHRRPLFAGGCGGTQQRFLEVVAENVGISPSTSDGHSVTAKSGYSLTAESGSRHEYRERINRAAFNRAAELRGSVGHRETS